MPEKDDNDVHAALPDGAFLDRAADALFAARTVLVFGEVTTKLARTVTAQLVALAGSGDGAIRMIVHSPGGHVEAGDTIHDVVRAVAPAVIMIGTGWVASAEKIVRDTDRNFWMSAKEAVQYGLVHRVVESLADVPAIPGRAASRG
jgi:ATP-dependent Clp protease protease subunit